MNEKGFTLIELMIVVVIIGILAAIAIPKFQDVTASSKEAACRANMRTIASQETIYFMAHFVYTDEMNALELSGLVCPSGSTYELSVYEYSGLPDAAFNVTCAYDPSHGNIENGIASWQGD